MRFMSATPDFTTVSFDVPIGAGTHAPSPTASIGRTLARAEESWLTAEGIAVKPRYGAADREGLDFVASVPGARPYPRGPYPTMYVTQPWTIRQ
jgi:methylmalonyl-CoA mutase